jgi:hypothetical protein
MAGPRKRLHVTAPLFRTKMTECVWLHGDRCDACCPLSKLVDSFDGSGLYRFQWTGKRWSGYTGQETVIIENYVKARKHAPQFDLLRDLINQWPLEIPRGRLGPTPFLAKQIIITSPLRMKACFVKEGIRDNSALLQLQRRIVEIDIKCKCIVGNKESTN